MKKILLIFLLVVISCGTRKVTKTSVDIAIEEKSITKDSISKQSIEISEIKDTTVSWVEEYEPIDSTKIMIVDRTNNKYQNVRFKTSKVKNGISISKTKNDVLKATKTSVTQSKVDYVAEEKDIKTDTTWPWPWWILIVIMGAGILYADYKRL